MRGLLCEFAISRIMTAFWRRMADGEMVVHPGKLENERVCGGHGGRKDGE